MIRRNILRIHIPNQMFNFFEKLRRTFSSESSLDKYKQIMFLKLSFLKKLQQPLKIDFLFVQVG